MYVRMYVWTYVSMYVCVYVYMYVCTCIDVFLINFLKCYGCGLCNLQDCFGNMAENGDPLLLQAFKDQVGGHFLIMEIDRDWICKPMQSRERLFYETVPEPIKQFIPQFGGKLITCFYR